MKWINKILTEETLELLQDLYNFKKNKKKILVFFLFLPLTFLFLIENLIIYLFFLFFYYFIFFYKYIKYKLLKKKTKKIKFKEKIFLFNNNIINDIFNFLKNIFFNYPKNRAFFNFYSILKIINKKNNKNKKEIIKTILKILFNRYLIILITGLPYLLIFCNTWFVNKFFLIIKLKNKEKASMNEFLFILLLNLNRDLMPLSKIHVKKMKIKFNKNKIILNPKSDINKIILELSKKSNLSKQILNIKKDSIITFAKNIKSINKEQNIYKWSNKHLETILFLNEEDVISSNETSKSHLYNNIDNVKIENIFYGNCSYKYDNCYVTKPIKSKLEHKSLIKNSINYNIKNIDYDKANYNQILAILFGLENGYIETKYIEEKNNIEFYYKENKENLINLIRNNKNFMKNSTYEAIENSNEFFKKVKELEENIGLNKKIMLTHESLSYNLINSNNNLYQLLKLK